MIPELLVCVNRPEAAVAPWRQCPCIWEGHLRPPGRAGDVRTYDPTRVEEAVDALPADTSYVMLNLEHRWDRRVPGEPTVEAIGYCVELIRHRLPYAQVGIYAHGHPPRRVTQLFEWRAVRAYPARVGVLAPAAGFHTSMARWREELEGQVRECLHAGLRPVVMATAHYADVPDMWGVPISTVDLCVALDLADRHDAPLALWESDQVWDTSPAGRARLTELRDRLAREWRPSDDRRALARQWMQALAGSAPGGSASTTGAPAPAPAPGSAAPA